MDKGKVSKQQNMCQIDITIVDFSSAIDMIVRTMEFCNLYKIGLLNGISYKPKMLQTFVRFVNSMVGKNKRPLKIYFEDSLLQQAGIRREDLPENCVGMEGKI